MRLWQWRMKARCAKHVICLCFVYVKRWQQSRIHFNTIAVSVDRRLGRLLSCLILLIVVRAIYMASSSSRCAGRLVFVSYVVSFDTSDRCAG